MKDPTLAVLNQHLHEVDRVTQLHRSHGRRGEGGGGEGGGGGGGGDASRDGGKKKRNHLTNHLAKTRQAEGDPRNSPELLKPAVARLE